MSLVTDTKKVMGTPDLETGSSKKDCAHIHQSKSTSSKTPYYVLGGLAALSVTSVALYAIYGSDDENTKNSQVAQNKGLVEGVALFGATVLAFGQAFFTDAAARMRMHVPKFDTGNELSKMGERFQYLESYTPSFNVHEDDDAESVGPNEDLGSEISEMDAESIASNDDYFDASDFPADEQQESQQMPERRRSSANADRDLFFPVTGEYVLNNSTVATGQYDSFGLSDGNIAYVFSYPYPAKGNLQIKDWQGNTLQNVTLSTSILNPSLTTQYVVGSPSINNYDLIITYASQQTTNTIEYLRTIYRLDNYNGANNPVSLFNTEPGVNANCKPIAHGGKNQGYLYIAAESLDNNGTYQVNNKVFFKNWEQTPSSFVSTSSQTMSVALGFFSDISAVLMYESEPSAIGQYLAPGGGATGNTVSLGTCYNLKSVDTANDLVFVSCINTDKLQGQAINNLGQQVITPFTIFDSPATDSYNHDLTTSKDGTRIIPHYVNGSNTYFKTYDQNGAQLGRPIQFNIAPGAYSPLATADNSLYNNQGYFIGSFLRNGIAYGRTFKENTPPKLVGVLSPPYAIKGEFFSYTVPIGSWIDSDGHALTFSGQVLDYGNWIDIGLNSTWMRFANNTNTFYGTPIAKGTLQVADIADDGYLFGDVTSPFSIQIIGRSPILGPLPSDDLTIGIPYDVQLQATSPDGDSYTFSSSKLPPGASLSTSGRFRWDTKSGDQGKYGVQIKVCNNYAKCDSGTMSLKVLNRAPVASPMPNRKFDAGTSLKFDASYYFKDLDGDRMNFTATSLGKDTVPSWAEFTNAGDFTGVPQTQDKGPFKINFTAYDPYGGATSEIGDFEIVSPNTTKMSVATITLISGVVGIVFTVLGCVYKIKQQKIDAWVNRKIAPYKLAASQKAHACMACITSCTEKTPSSKNVPLLDQADGENA